MIKKKGVEKGSNQLRVGSGHENAREALCTNRAFSQNYSGAGDGT
jgi:hypothetical protein